MPETVTFPDINPETTVQEHGNERLATPTPEVAIVMGAIAIEASEQPPGQHFKPNRITSIDVGSEIINPDTAPRIKIQRTVMGPDTITTRLHQ